MNSLKTRLKFKQATLCESPGFFNDDAMLLFKVTGPKSKVEAVLDAVLEALAQIKNRPERE